MARRPLRTEPVPTRSYLASLGRHVSRLLTLAVIVISLACSLAMSVLWVRSHRGIDCFSIKRCQRAGETYREYAFHIETDRGGIAAWSTSAIHENPSTELVADLRRGILPFREGFQFRHDRTPSPHYSARFFGARTKAQPWGFSAGASTNVYYYDAQRRTTAPHLARSSFAPSSRGVTVPCWFVVVLTAPLPAAAVFSHLWRACIRRRCAGWGQCPACGYDLRGSPSDRCPECGPAVPRAARRA